MKLLCLHSFATPQIGFVPGRTYDLPLNDDVRRWIDGGKFEVVEQRPHELAALAAGTPKKRGPGRPRKQHATA